MLPLALLIPLALARPLDEVPPGTPVVTVLLCPGQDGCEAEAEALAAWHERIRQPLLPFDRVAVEGAEGDVALRRWEEAIAALSVPEPGEAAVWKAVRALHLLPFTVPQDQLFLVHLHAGAAQLAQGNATEARSAFAIAASVGGYRLHDLPPLPPGAVEAYLRIAGQPPPADAALFVTADHPAARVYVDGVERGPVPARVPVVPGVHRVTVERPGRRTAEVVVVELAAGEERTVPVEIRLDDAATALQAALLGELSGVPAEPHVARTLAAWGEDRGLQTVRFVTLQPLGEVPDPDQVVPAGDDGEDWGVRALYLDVGSATFAATGTPPPERTPWVRAGIRTGYLRLGDRHHADLQIPLTFSLGDPWAVELRVGVLRASAPYHLYDDLVALEVFPVTAAVRYGEREGPYAVAGAYAVVPWALGGTLAGGWEIPVTPGIRLGAELQVVATDKALGAGAGVALGGWL